MAVVGPFNGWNPAVHAMNRRADGDWTVTIYLPPGRLVYLFNVDGEYWLDPNDDERMPNSWGSEYSVRHVVTTPVAAKDAQTPGAPRGLEDITSGECVCEGSLSR